MTCNCPKNDEAIPAPTAPLDAQAIANEAVVRGRRGGIVARVGGLASLYFLDGHAKSKRMALLQLAEEYEALYGREMDAVQLGHDIQLTPLTEVTRSSAVAGLMDPPVNENGGLDLERRSPSDPDDPSLQRIMIIAKDKSAPTGQISGVKMHFHPGALLDDPDQFVETMARWAGMVDAVHGTAGLGILTLPGGERFGLNAHRLVKQYPAAEFDNFGDYSVQAERDPYRPRSSNWLTILGAYNVHALGGAVAIRQQLDPGMTLVGFGGSQIIRTGQRPALGDGETGSVPESYRTAARIIKPIRFEAYEWSIFKVPDDMDAVAETLRWIRRFD